jgi:hypothetical protein
MKSKRAIPETHTDFLKVNYHHLLQVKTKKALFLVSQQIHKKEGLITFRI